MQKRGKYECMCRKQIEMGACPPEFLLVAEVGRIFCFVPDWVRMSSGAVEVRVANAVARAKKASFMMLVGV